MDERRMQTTLSGCNGHEDKASLSELKNSCFVSYAQNFEDVILWRALRHVEHGTYVDIGAQDSRVDSVSYAFYERGWRGVHVEPSPSYAQALRQARPEEVVIEAAVTAHNGPLDFHDVPKTGLSTGRPELAKRYEGEGFETVTRQVSTITLDEILGRFDGRDLHWLKIDVEGMEADVLGSWCESPIRPWIVLVESTVPGTPKAADLSWETGLLAKGYRFVYFDGLNRFYLSKEHDTLSQAFGPGPNVFDDFVLSDDSRVPAARLLARRIGETDAARRAGLEERRRLLDRLDETQAELRASAKQGNDLGRQLDRSEYKAKQLTQRLTVSQKEAAEQAEHVRSLQAQLQHVQNRWPLRLHAAIVRPVRKARTAWHVLVREPALLPTVVSRNTRLLRRKVASALAVATQRPRDLPQLAWWFFVGRPSVATLDVASPSATPLVHPLRDELLTRLEMDIANARGAL